MEHIPFNRVVWRGNEFDYIARALAGGQISGGGELTRIAESMIFELLGSKNLLTTSCTHALEMAALLLRRGDRSRDEVIVPAFTFVSTASAFALHGYRIKFADVRYSDLNIDPTSIESLISDRTRAVCVVNYAGYGADFERIRALCEPRGIVIIEDNAHGFGGKLHDKYLGTFGSMSTHSFHETKNISSGEGGNIVLNDESFMEAAEVLREKGTNRSRFLRGQVDKYTWVEVGSSWVQSDILAAVLVAQLERLEQINNRRMEIFSTYRELLGTWAETNSVTVPIVDHQARHTAHMFHLRFSNLELRSKFIEHLRKSNINAVFHYQALNVSPVGIQLGGRIGSCPVSESASDTLVRLPLYESLTNEEVERVTSAVLSFSTDDASSR